MITVFTPTYNRAYILPKLYHSLIHQTSSDFEWLIVDDGSTDNTEEVINNFISENKINLRYIKQLNGGKHRAINRGVHEAKGDLFFIVDSDDFLDPDAVSFYNLNFSKIQGSDSFAGISTRRRYKDGNAIGSAMAQDHYDCTALELRLKYNIQGDMAEAYRTEVLKRYLFPEIAGEQFCSEALVWNRIAQNYKLRFFSSAYYICEYLPDGLSSKITRIRMESPQSSLLHYSELESYPIPTVQKLKANINYWRFSFNTSKSFQEKLDPVNGFRTLVGFPLGLLMYLNDKRKT